MQSRIRFYDRSGKPLNEISANTKRSWLLNDFGECSFVFNKRDPKLTKSLVEFGNFVLVTNKYTKPWIGVIDLPRTWTRHGPKITAYSAEVLLSYHEVIKASTTNGIMVEPPTIEGSAGVLFKQMLDDFMSQNASILGIGSVYEGGVQRQQKLTSDFLTHAREIAARSGNDFDITAVVSSGRALALKANWYEKRGRLIEARLEEGKNIQLREDTLTEQGKIQNIITGIGADQEDGTKIGSVYVEADSVARYGKRHATLVYGDVTELETLEENIRNYAASNAYPIVGLRAVCTDKNLFPSISPGDTANMVLRTAGFTKNETLGMNETVRVLGTQADDKANTLEIVFENYTGG